MPTTAEGRAALIQVLACPDCRVPLESDDTGTLRCPKGHTYPIVRDVPRFVADDLYVRSFSFEWETHRTTLNESRRKDGSAERELRSRTGFGPGDLASRLVLDAGIGAGRFSEILARWGARVIGVDLSYAVDVARENLAGFQNALVVQADIGRLPFLPGTFDAIVSIGVLHHTPDTRRYFEALLPFLKPGGTIAIWVYPDTPEFVRRRQWIPFTSRIPPRLFYEWCRWFVPVARRISRYHVGRAWLRRLFPVSRGGSEEEDILNTFDGFSPRYHGVHSPDEVESWFREAGLVDIRQPLPGKATVRGSRPSAP